MTAPLTLNDGSAADLRRILVHRFPDQFTVFTDMFAMGCLLHFQGERCVANQLIRRVLSSVDGAVEESSFSTLLSRLTGNELRFAYDVSPSSEILELCDRAAKAPAREVAYER